MATETQVKKCIDTIAPLAQAQYRKGKLILPSVCIAQACCESAYLTSPKMIRANAVFGIKVGASRYHFGAAWKDKAYSTATKECYDGKTYTNITDMFRAYDTIAESVEDYYDILTGCKRYRAAVGENDYTKAITAIKNGGYATSSTYIQTITSIISKNNLTQYDTVANKKVTADNITLDNNPFTEPSQTIAYNSRGEGAKWVQWYLWRFGLIDKTGIDGIIGNQSVKAIKLSQERLGLTVDGKVGKETRKVWKTVC
jgi:peptidoglycan hydrolase-like protein with peptidoglycan-binding domain